MIRREVIFNETDFGQMAGPEVKFKVAIDVNISEEVNLSDMEHQHLQRQRRPSVKYGQDEYSKTATASKTILSTTLHTMCVKFRTEITGRSITK